MKDYYAILQVSRSSTEEEIRKSYRKLAMKYHPDHNPDSPDAAEKFKEIAEAYGVLTDPSKRREYDAYAAGTHSRQSQAGQSAGGFSYSQEDILKDLFKDPRFQKLFQGLMSDFQRSGYRSSPTFMKQCFFGNKGFFFLGGIFVLGSFAGPTFLRNAAKNLLTRPMLLKGVGSTIGSLFGFRQLSKAVSPKDRRQEPSRPTPPDTTYHLHLSADELTKGKTIQIVLPKTLNKERLKVKIPPQSKSGQKLRLRGKGQSGPYGRGDLFIRLDAM